MLAYKSGWGEIFERGVRLPPYVKKKCHGVSPPSVEIAP